MATHQHQWVKHIVVPIDVIADPTSDEGFYAVTDESRQAAAEENAVFGCAACSEPLSNNTVQTSCPGSDKSDPSH